MAEALGKPGRLRDWLLHPETVPDVVHKINRDYMYWGKAKHHAAAANVSENELWAFVKHTRASERYFLSFLEENDFSYAYTNVFQEKVFKIEQLIAEINKDLDPSYSELMTHYYIDGLIEEAIATSQFEGAQTQRRVAKDMLQSNRPPHTHHEYMIKNAYEVSKSLFSHKNKKMSLKTILDIHNRLIQHTKSDLKSDEYAFRTAGVDIVGHYNKVLFQPTDNPVIIQKSMDALVLFLNNESSEKQFIHPLVRAIVIHFWVGYLHPFYDGNGRTARMLFYWYLSQYDAYELIKYVPMSTTLSLRRKGYEDAYLFAEHDDNDLNYFIAYNLDLILTSLVSFKKHVKETEKKLHSLRERFQAYKLNWRQLSLLQHTIKNPSSAGYTINAYCEAHQITRITATDDLRDLCAKGFLVETKASKTIVFTAGDLVRKQTG